MVEEGALIIDVGGESTRPGANPVPVEEELSRTIQVVKQLAEKIGYSNATVSQVVNGRYSNSSYKVIAEKINEVLGTEGLPERTETPSDEWCQTVKVELVKQSMTVNELAKQLDVSRDRLSLVINGKMMNEAIVSGVNNLLGINLVAVPADK